MNLDHNFVQVSNLSEEKKKVSTKNGTLFSPNSGEDQKKKGLHQQWNTSFPRIQVDTYAQMHTRVKLLWGDADVDHTQTIGGDTAKLLEGYIPHPPWFRNPSQQRQYVFLKRVNKKKCELIATY